MTKVAAQAAQDAILDIFNRYDAGWVHDGDPEKPHAEMISGLCANAIFDCKRILCIPKIAENLATQLLHLLRENDIYFGSGVSWIVGSAYAAITFSYEMAHMLGTAHAFTEKDPRDPSGKTMLWKLQIPAGAKVLQIEDLVTTGHTFKEVRRAVQARNVEPVEFLPIVGALIHRPPKPPADYEGIKVVALVEQEVWAVKPEDCPLCKVGSRRLRLKANWAELIGKK